MLRDLYVKALRLQLDFLRAWAPPPLPPPPLPPLPNIQSEWCHMHQGRDATGAETQASLAAQHDYAVYARERGLPERIPRSILDGTPFNELSTEEQAMRAAQFQVV